MSGTGTASSMLVLALAVLAACEAPQRPRAPSRSQGGAPALAASERARPPTHDDEISAIRRLDRSNVCFGPEELLSVSASSSVAVDCGGITVIDMATFRAAPSFVLEGRDTNRIAFGPDGRTLAVLTRSHEGIVSRVEWFPVSAPTSIRGVALEGGSVDLAWSADGKKLLVEGHSTTQLVDVGTAAVIASRKRVARVFVSPFGAFEVDSTMRAVSILDDALRVGGKIPLPDATSDVIGALDRDTIVIAYRGPVRDGTSLAAVTRNGPLRDLGGVPDGQYKFLRRPDGAFVLVVSSNVIDDPSAPRLFTASRTGVLRPLGEGPGGPYALSADGRTLFGFTGWSSTDAARRTCVVRTSIVDD